MFGLEVFGEPNIWLFLIESLILKNMEISQKTFQWIMGLYLRNFFIRAFLSIKILKVHKSPFQFKIFFKKSNIKRSLTFISLIIY
jgi:hypothetical protein